MSTETDALNGLVAALETFVPPLIRSGVLSAVPFAAAIVEKNKAPVLPDGCAECWRDAVELADSDEVYALTIYRSRFEFCEHEESRSDFLKKSAGRFGSSGYVVFSDEGPKK